LLLYYVGELQDEKLVEFPVDVNSLCYKAPETADVQEHDKIYILYTYHLHRCRKFHT